MITPRAHDRPIRRLTVGDPEATDALAHPADGRGLDDDTITFGDLLYCLREARGLSQNALGHAAGVNASYINRLESGKRGAPSRAVTLALARVLDATPMERDRLLLKAGYAPLWLLDLNPTDPTLVAVARILAHREVSPLAREQFRLIVEALASCWYGQHALPIARAAEPLGGGQHLRCPHRAQRGRGANGAIPGACGQYR